jgi:hypothetical protein
MKHRSFLDHVKAAMPDLAENRAQDAQILFGYVRSACKELRGRDDGDPGPVTVNGMSIWFNKRSMQVFIDAQGAEEEREFRNGYKNVVLSAQYGACAGRVLQDRGFIDADLAERRHGVRTHHPPPLN